MRHPPFRVVPSTRAFAPARHLQDEGEARQTALQLALRYGITYDVWLINPGTGRGKRLATFTPEQESKR